MPHATRDRATGRRRVVLPREGTDPHRMAFVEFRARILATYENRRPGEGLSLTALMWFGQLPYRHKGLGIRETVARLVAAGALVTTPGPRGHVNYARPETGTEGGDAR